MGLSKLMVFVLCINLFMYIGVNSTVMHVEGSDELTPYKWNGDIFDILFDDGLAVQNSIDLEIKSNATSYGTFDLNTDLSGVPDQSGGQSTGEGGISFLDGLKILWSIIPTLWNIALSPITLFFSFGMPLAVGILVGIPLAFINILSIIILIRGGGG